MKLQALFSQKIKKKNIMECRLLQYLKDAFAKRTQEIVTLYLKPFRKGQGKDWGGGGLL